MKRATAGFPCAPSSTVRVFAHSRSLRRAALGDAGGWPTSDARTDSSLSELRARDFAPRLGALGVRPCAPYIEAARRRGIPGARFEPFDLDIPEDEPEIAFEIVLCLEALEHTGNYRIGLGKLARATRPGGYLLISVPNERGLPGVLKFFGRKVLMRQTYENFFRGQPQGPYVRALLRGANLETFRQPPRHGWGDHLGFDIVRFEAFLDQTLLASGASRWVLRRGPALFGGSTAPQARSCRRRRGAVAAERVHERVEVRFVDAGRRSDGRGVVAQIVRAAGIGPGEDGQVASVHAHRRKAGGVEVGGQREAAERRIAGIRRAGVGVVARQRVRPDAGTPGANVGLGARVMVSHGALCSCARIPDRIAGVVGAPSPGRRQRDVPAARSHCTRIDGHASLSSQ
jgi:SAM-dependent methyltransferase